MTDLSPKEKLKKLTKEQLQGKWLRFFKYPPPTHLNKSYLIKQITWCNEYKSLPKETQCKLDTLVAQYAKARTIRVCDIKKVIKFRVTPGTKLIREFQSVKHEVTALEKGFSYKEKTYKSLSSIATEITGTQWNGKRFFGVAS